VGKDFSNDRPEFEGLVRENVDPKEMISIIKANPNKSTALLTRTNPPLAAAAVELLSNGIPFTIIGRDFGGEVIRFFKGIANKMDIGMTAKLIDLVGNKITGQEASVDRWFSDEMSKHGRKATKKEYIKETSHMVNMLKNVAGVAMKQDSNVRTMSDLLKWVQDFFFKNSVNEDGSIGKGADAKHLEVKEDDDRVILTTAHRSKGFEFKRVFILDISKFPSPKARLPEDMAQEDNAKYVAFTRAEEELYILDDKKNQPTQ
jgi:superfamily I DNA/RNA helicase